MRKALTEAKGEKTIKFRMIKSTKIFNFSKPIPKPPKISLIRLSG